MIRRVSLWLVVGWAAWSAGPPTGAIVLQAQSVEPTLRSIDVPDLRGFGPVSPDGRFMAFRDDDPAMAGWPGRRDLSIRELATGTVRSLVVHSATERVGYQGGQRPFAWSHDGTRLAYVWCQADRPGAPFCDLRVIGLDGSAPRIVMPRAEGWLDVFHWSPDNRYVLALLRRGAPSRARGERRFELIAVENGSRREIVLPDLDADDEVHFNAPPFSPDGRYIVYTRVPRQPKPYDSYLPSDVFVIDLDRGTDRPLVGGPAWDTFVGWTPSGSSVLFTSDRAGSTDLWLADVADGATVGTPTMIRRSAESMFTEALTPDGRLFYQYTTSRFWDAQVVDFDPVTGRTTSQPRSVSTDPSRRTSDPAWSPDGKYLAYRTAPAKPVPVSPTDGYDAIVIRETDSGHERTVRLDHPCLEAGNRWEMAWSTDPRVMLLAITGGPTVACRGLYDVDIYNRSITPNLSGQVVLPNPFPLLLPDGSKLLIRSLKKILITDPKTMQERTVLDLTGTARGFEEASLRSVRLSHAADRVALVIETRDGQSRLAELDLTDGRLRVIQGAVVSGRRIEFAWTADDRHLLYVDDANYSQPGDVWRIPVGGGQPQRIGLTTAPFEVIVGLNVHPDGRRIAFQRERYEGTTLFVLENFLPQRALRPSGTGGR